MQPDALRAKRSSVPALAGPYGHPFHPIAVMIPIGAWVSRLIFDIGARVSSSHADALAEGARWLIMIGIIGAAVAAVLVILGMSGSLGGTLSYRFGVRVADETTQASGYAVAGDPAGGSSHAHM